MRALEGTSSLLARTGLMLLAGASLAVGQGAVERELRVRAWAFEPGRHREAWSAAAESGHWTDQIDAVDALTRALRFGSPIEKGWVDALVGSIAADHPNVQAALVRLLIARAAPRHELDERIFREQSSLIELREALLLREFELARSSPDPQAFSFLLDAARDGGDESLRSLARQLLARAGAELAPQQIEWLGRRGAGVDELALLDNLPELLAAGVAPELVTGLRAVARSAHTPARQKGLVELLDWRARGPRGEYEPELLVGAWHIPVAGRSQEEATLDARWLWVSRAGLHVGEPTLGAALLTMARSEALSPRIADDPADDSASVPQRSRELARDAALALVGHDPWAFVDDLPAEVAAAFLDSALARPADCQPDIVRSWCSDECTPELRRIVSRWLAEAVRSSGNPCASELLSERLNDPDPDLRELAFRALADAPQPRAEVLQASWASRSVDERLSDLRWLSREHEATPFRDDLLQFAAAEETRDPSVFQLLATFEGDAEVASALQEILQDELDQLTSASRLGELVEHEWHARSVAAALDRLLGPKAVPSLAAALERTLSLVSRGSQETVEAVDLPKKLIAILGRYEAGRAPLAPWLASDRPRRTRVEAALWILRGAADSEGVEGVAIEPVALVARKVLSEEYSACDSELGVRILRALGGVLDESTRKFLARVALDESEAFERRLAAVDALTSHAAQSELRRLLSVQATDIRVAAARGLVSVTPKNELDQLAAMFDARRVAFLLPDPAALEDPESLIAAEFLLGLVKRGALPDSELDTVLARPRARAHTHVAERFQAAQVARVEFTWSLELELVRELARRGRSASLFEREASWVELDGRLLAALSASVLEGAAADEDHQRARASLAVAERVARAASIALAGEAPSTECSKIEVALWMRRLWVAQARADWEAYAGLARRVLQAWRHGELSLWALEGALGERDLRLQVDPVARLRAAAEQADARAALQRGELGRARQHAQRARSLLGASRAAAEAQEDLEAELGR